MYESFVTVVGNVVADPVERTTRSGGPFTTFRVASTPRYRTSDGRYADGPTSFYGVCAFNVLAANAARSLQKGQPVIVHGKLRVDEWRDERDQPRTSVQIDALHVGHDLTWGQATFSRVSRAEALGHEPMSDPEVQSSLRAVDDGRPANVDENGVVHDPEPGEDLELEPLDQPGQPPQGEDNRFGDPDHDAYEVVAAAG
jgi:single-strand DNA-binding protein